MSIKRPTVTSLFFSWNLVTARHGSALEGEWRERQEDLSEFGVSLVYTETPGQPELHRETLFGKKKRGGGRRIIAET